jgi:hypothetical protein
LNDTLLIYEHPEDYFFPDLDEPVYRPFGVPHKSIRYLIYKLLTLFHLPGRHLFWGAWRQALTHAKLVILFDYGYQPGMELYIRRIQPDAQVVLFLWNKIDQAHQGYLGFSLSERIYSSDPGDCAAYGLRPQSVFYTRKYQKPWGGDKRRLIFVGHDKGRASYLHALVPVFTQCGITCDIRVMTNSNNKSYLRSLGELCCTDELSYSDYLALLDDYDILLDVTQPGQTGLTLRVLEAIFLSKKLITNNPTICGLPFYCDNNIFVLPGSGKPSPSALAEFLEKPFAPWPDEVLEYYDVSAWKERFFADEESALSPLSSQ